jgi:hypothetical protein
VKTYTARQITEMYSITRQRVYQLRDLGVFHVLPGTDPQQFTEESVRTYIKRDPNTHERRISEMEDRIATLERRLETVEIILSRQ